MSSPGGKKRRLEEPVAVSMAMPRSRYKLVGDYEKHAEVGRGTYGVVSVGVHRETRVKVAVKKVFGPADNGKREAEMLERCLGAPHVVQIVEVVEQADKVFLVLEYMESDLEEVVAATAEDRPELPVSHVKTYLHMLLLGVQELHGRGILHRDLKPNNVLLSASQHVAKLTDFGMATLLDPPSVQDGTSPIKRSLQVVTRAYRSPELFFGEEHYGAEVDVWSVGCIFAELLLRRVFCDGASDIDQLSKLFAALGSPDENGWSDAASLPFFLRFKPTNPTPLAEQFPMLSPAGVDLLSQLLQLDPKKRITVDAALQHPFFTEDPASAPTEELVIQESPERQRQTRSESEPDRVGIKGRRLL